jgi:hypothetical protein
MDRIHRKLKILGFINVREKQETRRQNLPPGEIVENHTTIPIPQQYIDLLSYGQNFATHQQHMDLLEDFAVATETSIAYIKENQEKEIVRNECTRIIQSELKNRSRMHNNKLNRFIETTKQQFKKWLGQQELYCIKSDKGNKMVLMYKEEYETKMRQVLESGKFTELTKNPLNAMKLSIGKWIKNSAFLTDREKDSLVVHDPSIPFIYGQPKIHKPNAPLRPIIAAYKHPRYKVTKYLNCFLSTLKPKFKYCIDNSFELKDFLSKMTGSDNVFLASLDVKDLFPSIPVDLAYDEVEKLMAKKKIDPVRREEILNGLKTCLESEYCTFRNKIYKMESGLAMGNPLSPFLANLVMERLESQVLRDPMLKSLTYFRYVDDILVIYRNHEQLKRIFHLWNTVHPNIQVTIENEENRSINFLDLTIRRQDNKFITSVYRKPTAGKLFIHRSSAHSLSQKRNIWTNFVRRAFLLSSTPELVQEEIDYLQQIAIINGFSGQFFKEIVSSVKTKMQKEQQTRMKPIDTPTKPPKQWIGFPLLFYSKNRLTKLLARYDLNMASKPGQKTCQTLVHYKKDGQNPLENSGIYKAICTCSKEYIGQTKRNIYKRAYEHNLDIRKKLENTGLSKHIVRNSHKVQSFKFIKHANSATALNIRESFAILKSEDPLNDHAGPMDSSWQYILEKTLNKRCKVGVYHDQ